MDGSPIGHKVVPSTVDRIEAEREVDSLTQDASALWRAAGAVPGQRSRFVDELLNERLTEALAKLRALEGGTNLETVKESISDHCAEIARLDDKHAIGDGFEDEIRRASSNADPAKWPEYAWSLIDALGERVAELRVEVDGLKQGQMPAPPPSNVRIVRPEARSAKPKLGSTTLALPGFEAVEPVVQDVVPSKIGKVEGWRARAARSEAGRRRRRWRSE